MTDEKNRAEVEIEGDRYRWWYVCSECHGYLNENDRVCRTCHREISWIGARLTGRKLYTGEQTEPAE